MGLKDIFRPQWRHSNWRVRKDAIGNLSDQSALTVMAFNDVIAEVRSAAVKKLTDEAQLAKVARKDENSDVRLEAIKKITDQPVLAEIVMNDQAKVIRETAMKKLTDQVILAKVFKEASRLNIREAATEKISDSTLLLEIAKDPAEDFNVRCAAVGNPHFADQVVLTENANYSLDNRMRHAAVSNPNLTDPITLARIAMNDNNSMIGLEAVKKLNEQAGLAEVAKQGESTDVRKAALEKLTDQAALAEIASNDPDQVLRLSATKKLSDKVAAKTMLIELAKSATEWRTYRTAMDAIDDEAMRNEISMSIPYPSDYGDCIRELVLLLEEADTKKLRTFQEYPEYKKIHWIGEQINWLGGMNLMQKAYYEVKQKGIYFSQDWWNYIGKWRA